MLNISCFTVHIEKGNASVPNFYGFAIQAVQAGTNNLLGMFSDPGETRQYLNCTRNEKVRIAGFCSRKMKG